MNNRRLLILGAGGHGKVAADCAAADGRWTDIIFYDDRWPTLTSCGPWLVAGRGADLPGAAQPGDEVFVAIGDNRSRLDRLQDQREARLTLATIIHPQAVVSPLASVGSGTLVVAGAVINAGAHIGIGCIINTGATVDHDNDIADGVHVAPGAHLAGTVTVGAGSLVGIGAVVRQQIRIGANVTVGAGAVVIGDLPGGVTAIGVPATIRR